MNLRMPLLGLFVVGSMVFSACGEGDTPALGQAQQLKEQFGSLKSDISGKALEDLLGHEDPSGVISSVQFIEVSDRAGFAAYEVEIAKVWASIGAEPALATEMFGHMLGDRTFTTVRATRIPNVPLLIEAIESPEFAAAMNLLAAASSDQAWVLGRALDFPPTSGSYVDPELQNLSRDEAVVLLRSVRTDPEEVPGSGEDVIIDMIVSDDPAPFWMANLIDFYEQAQYPDDPDTTLTGREAQDIYAQTIVPRLQQYNSFPPEFVVEVDVVLTVDEIAWELAVLQRYASRDAFLRIFPLHSESSEALAHKWAATENTIVLATEKPKNGR